MIQRVVLVRLKEPFRGDDERRQIAAHTRQVLGSIPLVKKLVVATPADEHSQRRWDLSILVQFDDSRAVEEYRSERTHRAYVDVYLRPMMEKIRAWNFVISDDSGVDP